VIPPSPNPVPTLTQLMYSLLILYSVRNCIAAQSFQDIHVHYHHLAVFMVARISVWLSV